MFKFFCSFIVPAFAVVVAVTAVAALATQGEAQAEPHDPLDAAISERDRSLSDGRTVTCLVYRDAFGSSLSCDWANAR